MNEDNMNKIKILIIDDAPEALDLLKEYLNEINCDIDFSIDFNISFVPENINFDYDVYIIDDMFLGSSKSVEITRIIRKHDSDAKIFIMSGQASEETLRNLINLRIDGFIDKDDMEVENIVKVCESIISFKKHVQRLNSKMTKLFEM